MHGREVIKKKYVKLTIIRFDTILVDCVSSCCYWVVCYTNMGSLDFVETWRQTYVETQGKAFEII